MLPLFLTAACPVRPVEKAACWWKKEDRGQQKTTWWWDELIQSKKGNFWSPAIHYGQKKEVEMEINMEINSFSFLCHEKKVEHSRAVHPGTRVGIFSLGWM